jgi:uncharacterized repeat protein (TIGR01451 family)
MKGVSSYFEAMSLGIVILLALFGAVQASDPYQVVIIGDTPPHSSSVVVNAGESIDMRVVVLNVTESPIAGSSLYLNYDPTVISNVSCIKSIYKEFNRCEEVLLGRYLFEGYDTFAKYTGDVVVAVLEITTNASAPAGSSTDLRISGPRPGAASGTPVWGPFWQEMNTPMGSGRLTISEPGPLPEIYVNKTANPQSGSPSTNVTFTIAVRNTGNSDLYNATVIDSLPEGMSYITSSPITENVSGQVVTWNNIGDLLSNGSPVTLRLFAHVDQGASGDLINSVTATGKPAQEGNVTDMATANFTAITSGIQVNKTVYPQSGAPSTNATFNITVRNIGRADLNNTTVIDSLPEGMSYITSLPVAENVSGQVVTWDNIGTLLSNGSPVSMSLVARVDEEASGNLTNSVTATGEPVHGSKVTSTAIANFTIPNKCIQVGIKAFPRKTGIMFPVIFAIKVTNTGETTLTNVTLKDPLPPGLIYLSSSPRGSVSGQKIVWNLGSMEPNDSMLIKVTAKLGFRARGTLKNEVAVEGTPVFGAKVTDQAYALVKVDLKKNMAYIAG